MGEALEIKLRNIIIELNNLAVVSLCNELLEEGNTDNINNIRSNFLFNATHPTFLDMEG